MSIQHQYVCGAVVVVVICHCVSIQHGQKQGHWYDSVPPCHLALCSLYLWCSSWRLQLWCYQWFTGEERSHFHKAYFLFPGEDDSEGLQPLHDRADAVREGKQLRQLKLLSQHNTLWWWVVCYCLDIFHTLTLFIYLFAYLLCHIVIKTKL